MPSVLPFAAGDSWGGISVPLIEANPLSGVLLFAVMIFVGLGMMNLILAVIVECLSKKQIEF